MYSCEHCSDTGVLNARLLKNRKTHFVLCDRHDVAYNAARTIAAMNLPAAAWSCEMGTP